MSRSFQRLGVNFLFVCLLVIVVGAFAGQWFAVMQKLGLDHNFWFGHQGWEYVDIGRFWQVFLFVGLMLWLVLVGPRAVAGAATPRRNVFDRRPAVPVDGRDRAVLRRRPDVGRAHAHLRWSNTGAGGSCTCGSKASSRCSPPR